MDLQLGFENATPPELPSPFKLQVQGDIPSSLRGTLYRNGPGRYTVYGDRLAHLFDGDGLVTAIKFTSNGVYYSSMLVQSEAQREEDAAGHRLYGTYGCRAPGGFLQRFKYRDFKNVSNTNIVYHWNKLWSLYEGGPPISIHPQTLQTIRTELLNGKLAEQHKFSAHPHRDPITGDLWNLGLTRLKNTTCTVYRLAADGEVQVPFQFEIPYSGILHDFAMTPNKLIFVVCPIKLPRIPIGLILGQRTFEESLQYYPEDPTQILILDKETGSKKWLQTDSFVNFHIANSWETDDGLVVDLCNFEDFSINQSMKDLVAGREPSPTPSYLERLELNGEGVKRRRLCETSMEFPRVPELGWGTLRKMYYGTSWADRSWLSVPMSFNVESETAALASVDPHHVAGEPVPIPKTNTNLDSAWLVATILDTKKRQSEIHIWDGDNISAPPVATMVLPQRIPIPLHGNWVPEQTH